MFKEHEVETLAENGFLSKRDSEFLKEVLNHRVHNLVTYRTMPGVVSMVQPTAHITSLDTSHHSSHHPHRAPLRCASGTPRPSSPPLRKT